VSREVLGYRRPDGRVGVRNHVVVLPVDDLSNAVCENVARVVPGVLALPHPYGRLQYGEDLELTFRTLIGNGANPNVAAAVVIGIEPNWTQRVAEGIARAGKPVEAYSIERFGDLRTLAAAARTAQGMLQDASELRREPVERRELVISIKCGESDTTTGLGSCPTVARVVDRHVQEGGTVIFGETSELTGGEHLIAARCQTEEVRSKFQGFYDRYLAEIEACSAPSPPRATSGAVSRPSRRRPWATSPRPARCRWSTPWPWPRPPAGRA
jgi:(2R)-sulfolactate sulfo-lyase subunit beta